MAIPVTVTFCVIYFLEAVLTLLGNILTIFVFWMRRAELKRTSYLLVNLAFADLLVAVSISFILSQEIRNLTEGEKPLPKREFAIFISWDGFCEAASLLNLLVISVERLYAVRWPFRHRTLSTTSYIYIIVFVWITAGLASLSYCTLFMTVPELRRISSVILTLFFLIVLILICVGYILIYLQTRQNIPEGLNERRAQQHKKLTKTLSIVTVLSLVCWFPSIVMALVYDYLNYVSLSTLDFSTHNIIRFVKVLQYANSIVNPIVYSFRMPLFKSEIKECFSKLSRAKKHGHTVHCNQQIATIADESRQGNINLQCYDTKL